jgi:hypothetical protein
VSIDQVVPHSFARLMSGVWDHHWLYGCFFLIQRSTCSPAVGALGFTHEIQHGSTDEGFAGIYLQPALIEMSMFAVVKLG